MVLTAAGLVAIEEIEEGDTVYSTDPETGESDYKTVVQTFVNETHELTHVTLAGSEEAPSETITTTPEHPFYVEGRGWVGAAALHEGMEVWLADGTKTTVEDVETEESEEPTTVYNFEVEDFHTYYVGESSALVHNDCGPGGGQSDSNPYSDLTDSKYVGEGKKFTPKQKESIIKQNMEKNGGIIKSDLSGDTLVPATKSMKGIVPNPLEAQIDHIIPRSKGGLNSFSNAQVLSRAENILKSNK